MKNLGIKNPKSTLESHLVEDYKHAFWNLEPSELINETLEKNQGTLTHNGVLVIKTGKFTGRSPKDRYIVKDDTTENHVDWNDINQPISAESFNILFEKITNYFKGKDIYIKDAAACNAKSYRLPIRLIAEYPWSAQFVHNMFVRLNEEETIIHEPEWVIYCAPGCLADPISDGTRDSNFSIINFDKKIIIIGGTGYTGEIKKGIFSVLNFKLPHEKNVLSMHCASNVGAEGDAAVFFGLSGTGKTTLSANPTRALIGDDEHGWSDDGLFNFEGGCYAKCIGLTPTSEPSIFQAIKPGAILENIKFHTGSCRPNFDDTSITQNTRVSYPIFHINNYHKQETAAHPENIFFLTCDAFGVLPPISKLSPEQAMYYFLSGYTAKIAGTEEGISEPQATFSACFGAPFLPLNPIVYAELLGEKIKKHKANIWLINTGWTAGSYGIGHRIPLKYTRAIITAVLNGEMKEVEYESFDVFNLEIPTSCTGVPQEILNPRGTWDNPKMYDETSRKLATLFIENFTQYENNVEYNIRSISPKVSESNLI